MEPRGSSSTADTVSKDEKIFALFSRLSIFIGGIFVPIVFWITNKDKSKFVTYHSLQAIWFHVVFIIFIILWAAIIVSLAIDILFSIPGISHKNTHLSAFIIISLIVMYASVYILVLLFFGYGIYLAIKSYEGNLTKYPLIGKIIFKRVYGD